MSDAPDPRTQLEDGPVVPDRLYNTIIRHILDKGVHRVERKPRSRWAGQNGVIGRVEQTEEHQHYSPLLRDALAVLCRHSIDDRCAVALFMDETGSKIYVAGSSASEHELRTFLGKLWHQLDALTQRLPGQADGASDDRRVTEEDVVAHIFEFSLPRLRQACQLLDASHLPAIQKVLGAHPNDPVTKVVGSLRQLCAAVQSDQPNMANIARALKAATSAQGRFLWDWFSNQTTKGAGLSKYSSRDHTERLGMKLITARVE